MSRWLTCNKLLKGQYYRSPFQLKLNRKFYISIAAEYHINQSFFVADLQRRGIYSMGARSLCRNIAPDTTATSTVPGRPARCGHM